MNRTRFTLAACLSVVALLFGVPAAALSQVRTVEHTANLEPGGRLTIEVDISDLQLTSWDENRVEVVAHIRATDAMSTDEGQRAVDATRVEVTGDAQALTVRADYRDVPTIRGLFGGTTRRLPHIDYEIRAPRQLQLTVDLDRSTADVHDFEGRIVLLSDRTRLSAADLTGDIRVDVDRAASVTLDGIRGTLTLESDRSPVTLQDLALTGDSSIDVGRGDLDLLLAPETGLTLSVDTERRSRFETELPMTTRQVERDRIEGTINGGGPRLSIETDRASVSLRSR